MNQSAITYLVGTEDTNSPDGFFLGKTLVVTLKQDKDVFHRDVLNVDLVLVVQVCEGDEDANK